MISSDSEVKTALTKGSYDAQMSVDMMNAINSYRASKGVAKLTIDSDAIAVAQIRAYEITLLYDHKRPTAVLTTFGIIAGENICLGQDTVSEAMYQFENERDIMQTCSQRSTQASGAQYFVEYDPDLEMDIYHYVQTFTN